MRNISRRRVRLLFFYRLKIKIWEKEKEPDITDSFFQAMFYKINLCALYSAGSQTASAHMQPLVSAIHLAFYILNVGIPDSVGSSMRMADILSEMCSFSTNTTFCHNCTSLRFIKPYPV